MDYCAIETGEFKNPSFPAVKLFDKSALLFLQLGCVRRTTVSSIVEGMSWNRSFFGYTAEEVVGKPVTLLIPPERRDEEPDILARIRRGERIEHYETVRQPAEGRSSKSTCLSEPKIPTDLPLISPEISPQVCTTRTTS